MSSIPRLYAVDAQRDPKTGGLILHSSRVDKDNTSVTHRVEHYSKGVPSELLTAGYQGTGPEDTATSILVDYFGEQDRWARISPQEPNRANPIPVASPAAALSQLFMEQVISEQQPDSTGHWHLSGLQIEKFVGRTAPGLLRFAAESAAVPQASEARVL